LLEFRYAPAGFAWGLRLACLAAMAVLLWVAIALRRHSTWKEQLANRKEHSAAKPQPNYLPRMNTD
jgi:hypothetical protein